MGGRRVSGREGWGGAYLAEALLGVVDTLALEEGHGGEEESDHTCGGTCASEGVHGDRRRPTAEQDDRPGVKTVWSSQTL